MSNKPRPLTPAQNLILERMAQGWTLKHGNFGGQWWMEYREDRDSFNRTTYTLQWRTVQVLLERSLIRRVAKDFHRGDTYGLVQAVSCGTQVKRGQE